MTGRLVIVGAGQAGFALAAKLRTLKDDRPITIVLAEFVPRNWWEWILHSQTALRLKLALLFRPNTIVIDVPYHFADTGHTSRKDEK